MTNTPDQPRTPRPPAAPRPSPVPFGPAEAPNGAPWWMIIDILNVLEQHGYRRGDDRHVGRAVNMIGTLARIYAGDED
jgi:hypothetical protein